MPRMQHAGQRPCADLSAVRWAGHRHHQTAAEGGADCFNHTIGFHSDFRHRFLDCFSPFHEQGHGPAKGGGATTVATAAKGGSRPPMVVNFQLPPVQPPPEPAWVRQVKLGGISGTPGHRFTIINGKMFETGDVTTVKITGKGVTIHCLEIGESSVSISIDGIDGTRELQMTGN